MKTFLNVDCNDWHNVTESEPIHVERKYHKDAIKDSHYRINSFEKPDGTIDFHPDTVSHGSRNKNPKILEVIAMDIHYYCLQNYKTIVLS